jgi:hypothetical protein
MGIPRPSGIKMALEGLTYAGLRIRRLLRKLRLLDE